MLALTNSAFIVEWKELERWIIPKSSFSPNELPDGWTLYQMGELVTQVTERVRVAPDSTYKMVGVKWYGEGTFHRETVQGDNLSATYVTSVVENSLIYNRLFAWKGSFAVVPTEHNDCFVSSEFPQFQVDKTRTSAEYLYLFLMRDATIAAVNNASIGSAAISRNRFKEEEFTRFEIPLPPLPVQQAIVAHYQRGQNEAAGTRKNINCLETDLLANIAEATGLDFSRLNHMVQKPRWYVSSWQDIERWGVEFNRWDWALETLLQSNKYTTRRLGDIADVNPGTSKHFLKDDQVSFVPMEAISEVTGEMSPRKQPYNKVSSGYTVFANGDVIWAKITPCMENGKSAVASGLISGVGFGSTEFHVIRAKTDYALPEYIWVMLRLPFVRKAAKRYFIGSAGQQRVPAEFLRELAIPLPPLKMQAQIVAQVQEGRAEIAREKERAESLLANARAEVEAMILGLKAPPDLSDGEATA